MVRSFLSNRLFNERFLTLIATNLVSVLVGFFGQENIENLFGTTVEAIEFTVLVMQMLIGTLLM